MIRPTLFAGLFALSSLVSPAPAADPRLEGYRTPPGWKVEIAATEPLVVNPVTMTFGDDGRLYVVEWQAGRGPNDRIKVLTDKDGDGTFDESAIYMDGLDLPAGVLFWDGWTYVTLEHDVVRLKDEDGDGKFEKRESIVTGFGNDNSHHRVSGLTLGPDGWLYITTGDSDAHAKGSDGSEATVLRCGGVFRCKPDGSKLEMFAMGMRNPFGNVAFDDEFRIFHTDNDNEGSPGFTGCRLLHVVEGGDYGWRLREGARCCQPDFDRATWNGGRPGRLGWIAETGRGAPAGLAVLNSAAFPPATRNLLIYPDVFRKLVRAYKLRPAGATFTVDKEYELLASNDPLFRPDDAEVGPDGALYILDWRTDSGGAGQLSGNGKTGRIYRMTWAGTESEPARPTLPRDRFVKLLARTTKGLGDALASDDYEIRRRAGLELIRRNPPRRELIGAIARDYPYPGGIHAMVVKAALNAKVAMPPIAIEGETIKEKQAFISRTLGYQNRMQMESDARSHAPDDAEAASSTLFSSGVVARGIFNEPQAKRAYALALGHFKGLRRQRQGEEIDSSKYVLRYQQDLQRTGGLDLNDKDAYFKALDERQKKEAEAMSTDLLADRLLVMAVDNASADPFLRDAFTRGLERLGPAGIEAVIKAIGSDDKERAGVALYALQGWRNADGLSALLAEAISANAIPSTARAGLFRALREFGPAVPPEPIADWVAKNKQADPAPRAAAIRVLTAMGPRAVLAAGPIVAPLLAEGRGEVFVAALNLAGVIRSAEAKAELIRLVKSPDLSDDERRLAFVALKGYDDRALAPIFAEALKAPADPALRGEVLRALASLDFARGADAATALLGDPSREVRAEAIAVLGQKPETALQVVRLYVDGKLPKEDLARVIEAIRPHKSPEISAAFNELTKKRMVGASGAEEVRQLGDFVRKRGNAARGKAVYLDAAKANCASCHRMEGSGGAVGPDLTRVWETLSFEKKVESILDPSKEIKEGYNTFKVATRDGRTLSGLLLSDTAEGVTLKDAQGREVKVPAGEIEEKGTDKVSLMPDGVVAHLSPEEFADLLAFLGDRGAQESLKTRP